MNYKKIKGMHFVWFKWVNGKCRWLYWECQPPIWWKPRIEKYTFGKRIGWLYFAVGTGVVTQQMMQIIIEEFSK